MIHRPLSPHYGGRLFEWFSALALASFGATLLHPYPTFSSPAYAGFRAIGAPELSIGASALALGAVWALALFINGRWRRSPLVRLCCALAGATAWGGVAGSFWFASAISGAVTTAAPIYTLICMLTIVCCQRVARDVFRG